MMEFDDWAGLWIAIRPGYEHVIYSHATLSGLKKGLGSKSKEYILIWIPKEIK